MHSLMIALVGVLAGTFVGTPRASEPALRQARQLQRTWSVSRADSLEARRLAADAVQRFLINWRKEWLRSEGNRIRLGFGNG